MSRSLKKGPFVDASLMEKVEALNKVQSSQNSLNTLSLFITDTHSLQFM